MGGSATKVWDDIQMAYRTVDSATKRPTKFWRITRRPARLYFASRGELARTGSLDPALGEARPRSTTKSRSSCWPAIWRRSKALGDKDAPVKALLNGKTPQQAAEAGVMGTTLKDPAERRKLAGNPAAVKASADPLLKMALLIEDPAKRLRKKHEDMIGSLEASAEDKIAGYRFKLFGAAIIPTPPARLASNSAWSKATQTAPACPLPPPTASAACIIAPTTRVPTRSRSIGWI